MEREVLGGRACGILAGGTTLLGLSEAEAQRRLVGGGEPCATEVEPLGIVANEGGEVTR